MIIQTAKGLRKLGADIFAAQGLSRERADFLSETIVEASLTGHDSHGVSYFVTYSDRIKKGYIDIEAEPTIAKETDSTALVDGHYAPGQITARYVMELAVRKAKERKISAVGACNCNHIGRVGYYTDWAARQGVVAMMFVNVGSPSVTVYNGLGRIFGTNPFSAAVPTGESNPFLLDYATSVVAAGKLGLARVKGERIPTNWARDKDGNPTDDPWALRRGGWLLPFGEHKGYCLQLLTELLGAVLTGSRTGPDIEREPPSTNGVLAIALDPDSFVGLDAFKQGTSGIIKHAKGVMPEPGKRVLVPGEPEWETKVKRLKEGIPIPESTWKQIMKLTEELEIDLPD
ncbi:MAG: Ldh family oxidoreductase [Candidatus Bathyarchaeia archaeon]